VIVHRLPVGGGHVMHVEEHGNPAGLPVLVLHGGPGSGSSPVLRRCFDEASYRIICPDQRGAGQSTPRGGIEANTVDDLLADLRALRAHLCIPRWLVVGGSWGATLALLHTLDASEAVAGLLLRNVFLARAEDINGFFAAAVRDDGPRWRELVRQADAAGCTMVEWLARVFANGTPAAQREAALCWFAAEQRLAGAATDTPPDAVLLGRLVQRYRVQSHYLRHQCWLRTPSLLERCAALPDVPTLIVHGSEDAICPPEGASALAQVLGGRATLRWVRGAGHDPCHPEMMATMTRALREFAIGDGALAVKTKKL
jgi:proline iminopeptidase